MAPKALGNPVWRREMVLICRVGSGYWARYLLVSTGYGAEETAIGKRKSVIYMRCCKETKEGKVHTIYTPQRFG